MCYFVALLYWPLKTICINLFPAWWGIQTAPRLWFKVKDTRFRDHSPNYAIVTKWDSVSVHEHALCSARDRSNGEMNPARAVSNGRWKAVFGKGARDRLLAPIGGQQRLPSISLFPRFENFPTVKNFPTGRGNYRNVHFFSTVHPPKSCAEVFCAFITC